jgi:hypothetical protein
MRIADVAGGEGLRCLRQRRQLARHLDLVRRHAIGQVAFPTQPRLGAEGHGAGIALALVEAPEPAQGLGLDAAADALESNLVIAHGLRRDRREVFIGELIEDGIDLLESFL